MCSGSTAATSTRMSRPTTCRSPARSRATGRPRYSAGRPPVPRTCSSRPNAPCRGCRLRDAEPRIRARRNMTCWGADPGPSFLTALCLMLGLLASTDARAQAPDIILINGRIVVYDTAPAQALAVRDGKITGVGNSKDIGALAGPSTRVVDLGGRTVIPGLIDSHIHAIRAGLSFTTEVQWIGIRTLAEALDRIRAAAKRAPKGG